MKDKTKIESLISKLVYSLESDGFYHIKTNKYLFKMQKEVIWPIGNKSIYKIKFFVSDYSTTEEYYYSLFMNLVDNNHNTLIYSKSRYDNERETIAWLSDCSVLAREILDVAYFITKVFGTYKNTGRMLRSEFYFGSFSYYLINKPIVTFNIEKEHISVMVNSLENYISYRKFIRLSDIISLDQEYIIQNLDEIFK